MKPFRPAIALCLAVLTFLYAPIAIASDYVLIVKNGVSKLYVVEDDASLTPVEVRVVQLDGPVTETPVTPAPPIDGLTKWVKDRADAVPAHSRKDGVRNALASAYSALAGQWDKGGITNVADFMKARRDTHATVVAALGARTSWEKFDADLVAELNRLQIRAGNLSQAMLKVSEGLSSGKALDPELIGIMLKLVLAVISKNPSAVADAVSQLVGLHVNRK